MPEATLYPDDEIFPGLLMARTEGRLFFANAASVIDELWTLVHAGSPQVVILDCDAIPDIEYTALKSLTEFEEQLAGAGAELWLAALNPTALRIVEQTPLGTKLGQERIYLNLEEALDAYQTISMASPKL